MIVMMIAITASLNASSRPLPISPPLHFLGSDPDGQSAEGEVTLIAGLADQ